MIVLVLIINNWRILRVFKGLHALLTLHLRFKFTSVGIGNILKLIAPPDEGFMKGLMPVEGVMV